MGMIMNVNTLGALFEASRDAVVGVKDNEICFANPTAQRVFSLHTGADAAALFPPELFAPTPCASAALTVNDRAAEASVRLVDGVHLLFLHPRTPCEQDEEMTTSMRMARALSDSLMNLRMALDALLKRCETEPRAADYACVLYREYYRMRRLCGHLAAAENIARGALPVSPTALDLAQTVRDLVDSVEYMTSDLGVSLHLRCDSGDYITEADGALIETMLLNFLANSFQRCEKGGHITVSLRRAGNNFILSVDDDGSGMTASSLAGALHGQLDFDLHDTLSGAGLGLTVARGIAEKHGGTLILESREGEGCRVRVLLPQRKPDDTLLRNADPVYAVKDMNGILTELSVVLPTNVYKEKFFD